MEQLIKLVVKGKELTFTVTTAHYNRFINETTEKNKVTPAHNFVMRCVMPESKDDVKTLLDLPGAAFQVAGALIEEFMPDLEIELGK